MLQALALISATGLALVWVIYPGFIWLWGMVKRPRRPGLPEQWPAVTVVLATREAPSAVIDRVRNLLDTSYPLDRLEIIVARDARLADPDLSTVVGSGSVRLVRPAAAGKAAALNAGVAASDREFLVFADTHQRFEPNTIPQLIAHLLQPGTGAVTGNYRLAEKSGIVVSAYWRFERWLRRREARVHSSVGATGAVYAIRRSLWTPLPEGLILDDVYTPMRVVLAGQRVAFAESACAIETRTPTAAQEYGRKVRTLTGVLQLCVWLPDILIPIRNPIWLQFMIHKLWRLLTPYWVTLILAWGVAVVVTSASRELLLGLAIALGVALSWIAIGADRWGARIRQLVLEAAYLQMAVLVAGINGIRGHWRVWDT